jgi:hypothetical protein
MEEVYFAWEVTMRISGYLLLALAAAVHSMYAQNLISNPGFESDSTGWPALYTRVSGTGTRTIVPAPVHSGVKAAHIRYWGTQDWGLQTQADFMVRAGQLYEYSVWVRTDSLASGANAEISVVLMDSARQALNWSYAAVACTLSTGVYSQYLTRLIIPSNTAYIRPRIIGSNPVDMYADDFSLRLVDSVPALLMHPFVLQNDRIRVSIDPVFFSFDLTSKATAVTRSSAGVGIFQTLSVDSFPDSVRFHCTYLPGNWPVILAFSINGPALSLSLRADSAQALARGIDFPGPITSLPGEYLIIPNGTGIICPAQNAPAYMDRYFWLDCSQWQVDMGFTGVTDLTKGYMVTSDDPWFTQFSYNAPGNADPRSLQVTLLPGKKLFARNRTLHYTVIDTGGYVSMCSWYRSHAEEQGYVKTWAQKTQTVAVTDRLKGAVDFWINGGGFWYSNAGAFRDLIDYGMDRAIFSGNFSNSVVDTLNTLGFLTSEYDCYCDAYPPGHAGFVSDGYNTGAIVNEDGSYKNGWLAYINNNTDSIQAQEVCSATHAKYALPRITAERAAKRLTCRFIDVELAIGLQECWSPAHPVNHYTDACARRKLFDTLRTAFGLVLGGEQARDFAFPFVDYGEGSMSFAPVADAGYDWKTPEAPDSDFIHYDINPAIHVPLHGLVYHDVHIPTWYTGDGVSKVPAFWDDKDLYSILYASMPLFMPPDTGYWKTNFERFLTSYHLVSAVTRSAGFAKMIGHKALSADWKVQQTSFDNGWNVTVNFDSTASYALGARVVAPRGFYATDGQQEVSRLLVNGQKIAAVRLADRIFVNGYGTQQAAYGLRSSGAAYLKQNGTFANLAFIGKQASIDLDTLHLAWPVTNLRVFTKDRSQTITPTAQADGFVRITRIPGIDFYRLEGSFTGVNSNKINRSLIPFAFTVTRFHHGILVRGTSGGGANKAVTVTVLNAAGRTVASMHDHADAAGAFTLKTGGRIPAGVYIVRVITGTGAARIARAVIDE